MSGCGCGGGSTATPTATDYLLSGSMSGVAAQAPLPPIPGTTDDSNSLEDIFEFGLIVAFLVGGAWFIDRSIRRRE